MRNYALAGRRQRALAQFHLLRESLRREFEDEPEEQTRRLYQEILTRRLGARGWPRAGAGGQPGELLAAVATCRCS